MAFEFVNPWKGGALGKLGAAILALQYALEHVKGENRIIVEKHADGSFTVKYGGQIARNGWNGKIYRAGFAAPLVDVDVKSPINILGEYVCVNVETWSWEWADEAKEESGWSSFHVAEPWNDPNGDLPESFGNYALTADFNGSIVIGGGSGGLSVAGTPELFKVCALTGWTLDSEGAWTQMSISAMVASPPTTLWSGQTEAGNYLRPTWDYVRAYEEEGA